MSYVRVVPLGGLGEIGMNCLALESPDGVLVIDCGITFPHRQRGIDVIHPVFDYLEERVDELLGVVITHGHEDHIGALPYLLHRIPVPVWAPPYALSLIRERLKEHPEVPPVELKTTTPRVKFDVGRYVVEPLRVTHSIPDSTALAVETPGGLVIHTGDFKLEADPMDGLRADQSRFEALGDRGVALLLSDSTNVDTAGTSGQERDVAEALRALVASKRKRVVIGIFPSNIYRMSSILAAAAATNRRVCLLGRSMHAHARAASELGRLGLPPSLLVPPERAREVPRGELLVLASGTQAEPQSALTRLSNGEHPKLALDAGDAVVFSSRTIPGNERSVWDLVCAFERRGMEVHLPATDPSLHVSGHACRSEQETMLKWTRPQGFIPVHGNYHHLARHASLAKSLGVPQVTLLENGQTASVDEGGISMGPSVPFGRVHVDDGVEVSPEVIRDRGLMCEFGVVFASVTVDRAGAVLTRPVVSMRGVVTGPGAGPGDEETALAVDGAVREALAHAGRFTVDTVREAARKAVRKVFAAQARKPLAVVNVTVM